MIRLAAGLCAALLTLAPPAVAAAPVSSPQPLRPADRAGWEDAVRARFGADARLSWDALRATPTAIRRLAVAAPGIDPASRALAFCAAHRDLLGLSPALTLSVDEVTAFRDGVSVKLAAGLDGLVVEGSALVLTFDASGAVRAVQVDPTPAALAPIAQDIGPAAAGAAVRERFGVAAVGRATRVAFWRGVGPARQAWRVPAALIPWVAHFYVWVDAASGAVLGQAPVSNDQPVRRLEVVR